MTRVKICGCTREVDVEAAVAAGADAIGVITDVPVDTPREVRAERAAALVDAVPPFATTVLVTMPEEPGDAIELVEAVEPDVLQIHGSLAPEDVAAVRESTPVRVIKTVDAADPERAAAYDDVVDALLVDSIGADGGGGTGHTHDWERTREATADLNSPLVLAGGLTPANVAEAIRTVEPYAVDVASGVESAGGIKDHDAVAAFVERARSVREVIEREP